MRTFTYIGEHEGTEVFGLRFPRDVPVEVSDPHALTKLPNNRFFVESFGGVEVLEPVEPKRRGRPPKVT